MKVLSQILFIAVFAVLTSSAATVVYTDLPSFLANTTVDFIEDFNDGILHPRLTIAAPGSTIAGGKFNDNVNMPEVALFSIAGGTFAFGGFFDLAGPGGPGSSIDVSTELGGVGNIPSSTAGTFWGFVSTDRFFTVTLSEGPGCCSETYSLEDLHVDGGLVVPEPATWGLMAAAGLALIATRLRSRR